MRGQLLLLGIVLLVVGVLMLAGPVEWLIRFLVKAVGVLLLIVGAGVLVAGVLGRGRRRV